MRRSRSHSTGMFIQRLSAAASDGLRPAISFMRSKNSRGKMCGKMSSRCSGCLAVFLLLAFLLILDSCHVGQLAPACGFGADDPPERLPRQRLSDFLADVDDPPAVLGERRALRQFPPQPLHRLG